MGKLIPLILILVGAGAGVGAGLALRPHPEPEGEHAEAPEPPDPALDADGKPLHDYAKLNNQFIVPVVEDGEMAALVVLSLSLEVRPGMTEVVYAREPKLRDALLQVLFAHANNGGFRGSFTENTTLQSLRLSLLETARSIVGPGVSDVLILDLMRQDR